MPVPCFPIVVRLPPSFVFLRVWRLSVWFRCENPSTWNLITFTCKQKKKLNFLLWTRKGFLFPFREASRRLQVIYHLKFYRISNDLEAHICLHSQKTHYGRSQTNGRRGAKESLLMTIHQKQIVSLLPSWTLETIPFFRPSPKKAESQSWTIVDEI